jgi:hypothetical protein
MGNDCNSFKDNDKSINFFKFCGDGYWYCRIFGFIGWFFFVIIYVFSIFYAISTTKSIYDLIVGEIIHRDVPLCYWINWKKIFHTLLPFIQIMQFLNIVLFCFFICLFRWVSITFMNGYCVPMNEQTIPHHVITATASYLIVIFVYFFNVI